MATADSPLHERMIFNVGAQRSGTFWLQRVVAAHPRVSAVPSESALFSHGIAPLFERFQHAARDSPQVGALYIERQRLIAATRSFCDVALEPFLEPGSLYLAERTAVQVGHLELIAEIYPDARFVHIVRDGRDVARSVVAQPWGVETVEEAAAEWRACIEAARAADLPADRYREVFYEQLLQRPEQTIPELYEWLGLPAGEGEHGLALAEAERKQNVDRHGRPGVASGKWRESFTDADVAAFDRVAGDLLAELGLEGGGSPDRTVGEPRSVRKRARGLLGRSSRKGPAAGRGASGGVDEPAHWLELADRAVTAVRTGRPHALEALAAPDLKVSVVNGSGATEERGAAAYELLARLFAADSCLSASETFGNVFAGGPTIGYVLRFDSADAVEYRVIFAVVAEERIAELTIYALPGELNLGAAEVTG